MSLNRLDLNKFNCGDNGKIDQIKNFRIWALLTFWKICRRSIDSRSRSKTGDKQKRGEPRYLLSAHGGKFCAPGGRGRCPWNKHYWFHLTVGEVMKSKTWFQEHPHHLYMICDEYWYCDMISDFPDYNRWTFISDFEIYRWLYY